MVRAVSSALFVILFIGCAFAEDSKALRSEEGEGKLYFTGPGYTINLIPQAILLGILAFLAAYFLGLGGDEAEVSGYGAPEPSYGAPEPSYSAPSSEYGHPSRYYDTYPSGEGYGDARKKRSAF